MVLYRSPEFIWYAWLEQDWKYMTICCISFHPCRSIRKRIRPCHKNGQCRQPSGIIWKKFVVPEYPLLYTMFQGHRPLGSEEGDFLNAFTIYGPVSHLSHVTLNIWTNFQSNIPWRLHMILASNGLVFLSGKEIWKCWIWVTLYKGQWMTLTLGCHKSSCTLNWLYVPTFTSQASIVSWKSTAEHFPIQKQKGPNLTLL